MEKKLSRREFLQIGAVAAAGAVVAACAPTAAPAPTSAPPTAASAATAVPATSAPTAAPPAGNAVAIDVWDVEPAYDALHKEIWHQFETENPGITINSNELHEPTFPAFQAKLASGYIPAIATSFTQHVNKFNYQEWVDLSTVDYPYWDRWTIDAKNAWTKMYGGLPGPRTLYPHRGYLWTWLYHEDYMKDAGLDPRKDVKTWEDLENWLDEGTKWAKSTKKVDYFWDVGWHNENFSIKFPDATPMALAGGDRDAQLACYTGKAKFNAPDSPYALQFQWFKKAYDKGWMPEKWFQRAFQEEHQAAIIAHKSVMAFHGPWLWEKVKGSNPNASMSGIPGTPPAQGQKDWLQFVSSPQIDFGYGLREGIQKKPEFEQAKKAFFWRMGPEGVRLFAEGEARETVFKTDQPVNLTGGQYTAVVKEFQPGGLWPNVKTDDRLQGEDYVNPFLKKDGVGAWDWNSNNNQPIWEGVMTNKMTIQQACDWLQANWDKSYDKITT